MTAQTTRFDEETVEAFNNSREGKGLTVCFFFFALFFMWPYQTMVQMQTFLVNEFPDKRDTVGNVMMICTTWPVLITTTLLLFSGMGRSLPYGCKMSASFIVTALSVFLLIVLIFKNSLSQGALLMALYAGGVIEAVAEAFIESGVTEMAGLFPSTFPSQNVQAGNGACGVFVSCVQLLTRLITSGFGPVGTDKLRMLTTVFVALMGVTSLANIGIYKMKVKPSQAYLTYVRQETLAAQALADTNMECPSEALSKREILSAAMQAFRYVWPSCLAVSLVLITSLITWPTIPGTCCVGEGQQTLQSWWMDLIILVYNVADFLGKNARASLQWGVRSLSPMADLWLALLRAAIFIPLIVTSSAPQLYPASIARWVAMVSVFGLGVSNGWLSTVCFMRAPKLFPPGTPNAVAEQASTVVLLSLFVGISSGCLIAYVLGQHLPLGQCYGA